MTRYCTVAQAKLELESSSTVASLTANLLSYANVVSRRIDNLMGGVRYKRPYFAPYLEQRSIQVSPRNVNSVNNTLLLNNNLLAIDAVSIGGTVATGSVTQYPPNISPFQALQLANTYGSWYACTTAQPPFYALVTGVWGYHSDYANAWETITTLNGNITSSTTSVIVTSATNLSEGHLIRVDDEYMEITTIATNTLTVKRAQNGTTASAHLTGGNVDIFLVEPEISRIVARQCALMVTRKGAFEVSTFDAVGAVQYPQDLLTELWAVLQEYQYGG